MKREQTLAEMSGPAWDVVIIGGGATGLGAAFDAASRGLRTLLIDRSDFAKATSSRSTKLIHGGVRYLRQGNVSLVRESLQERGLLLRNAPELVRPLEFILPTTNWLARQYYAVGLKAYDFLAGRLGIAGARALSTQDVQRRTPALRTDELSGGVAYFDAQFDDAGLALAIAAAATTQGAWLANYTAAVGLLERNGRISGVRVRDEETGREWEVAAKVVINATGVFTDEIRRLDRPTAPPLLQLSRGAHLVLDRKFFPGETAVIIPETDDGRVLFFIPWLDAVLVGTTDVPTETAELEPRPSAEEIEYLLDYCRRYLTLAPQIEDIRSCFAGLRPLVKGGTSNTAALSRDHTIEVSPRGLVTICGGKWTTFRKMGEDAVATALGVAGISAPESQTESALLKREVDGAGWRSDEVVRTMIRQEMARTVDDVLARRSRALLLNAREALAHAPRIARLLADELHRPPGWADAQVGLFTEIASGYLPSGVATSPESMVDAER